MSGPLAGLRVVELGGIGPGPHAAMVLADLGAEVVRIQRTGFAVADPMADHLHRNRRLVQADLKDPEVMKEVARLVSAADALVEGFRPGVAERLGLGPDDCLKANPALVYGRVTGWGREGPLADAAGHDINYLALSGALHTMGDPDDVPTPPLNLVGDFGGGSYLLVIGLLAALQERQHTGLGQVVDAAMTDGVGSLMQAVWAWRGIGLWSPERGTNLTDGSRPYYRCYRCADDRFVAVGAIEPQFYAALIERLGLEDLPDRDDPRTWPRLAEMFADAFSRRTRDQWAQHFQGTDACVSPVLAPQEVPEHPQMKERSAFVTIDDVQQPVPAPRFSRSAPDVPTAPRPTELSELAILWRDMTPTNRSAHV